MAMVLTRHKVGARDILGEQVGDAIVINDGNVSDPLDGSVSVYYRARCTSDCTVRIGDGLSDASGGETWKADEVEPRLVPNGFVVAVDA